VPVIESRAVVPTGIGRTRGGIRGGRNPGRWWQEALSKRGVVTCSERTVLSGGDRGGSANRHQSKNPAGDAARALMWVLLAARLQATHNVKGDRWSLAATNNADIQGAGRGEGQLGKRERRECTLGMDGASSSSECGAGSVGVRRPLLGRRLVAQSSPSGTSATSASETDRSTVTVARGWPARTRRVPLTSRRGVKESDLESPGCGAGGVP